VVLLDGCAPSNYNADAPVSAVHPSNTVQFSAQGQAWKVKATGEQYYLTDFVVWARTWGSPTGHLKAVLYNPTGVYGQDMTPTGASLAESDLIDVATLSGTYAQVTFHFSGANQYVVLKDTAYCVAIQVVDGSWYPAGTVAFKGNFSDGSAHDGDEFAYRYSEWEIVVASDLCFYVYGDLVPPPQKTLTIQSGSHGSTSPVAGAYNYTQYTYSAPVTAYPDGGYYFDHWVLDVSHNISQNPITVYMDADHTIYPIFLPTGSPPSGDWISPTANEGTDWNNPAYAYDENTGTYANPIQGNGWSSFLILTHDPIYGGQLRFWAFQSHASDQIQIDVYEQDGTWHNVYTGTFTSGAWVTKTFTSAVVSKARIRFNYAGSGASDDGLYEFDFYGVAASTSLLAKVLTRELAYLLTGADMGKVVILV